MRLGAVVAGLALAPVLSACAGFTPVYGENGLGSQRVDVKYASPSNRLEQVIYQDLALKLGKSTGDVPVVTISAAATLPTTDTSTATLNVAAGQVTVRAFVSVVGPDGKMIVQNNRSVVENFVNGGQAFSNQEAANEASERGAKELAESIRLEILGALVKQRQ
jgi:hypothetical protein